MLKRTVEEAEAKVIIDAIGWGEFTRYTEKISIGDEDLRETGEAELQSTY